MLHCHQHTEDDAVVKELLLIKYICGKTERTEALQIIDHFGGKGVDLTPNSMIAMITGDTPKIDAAVRMFSQFEIIETVRTGKVVMVRGDTETYELQTFNPRAHPRHREDELFFLNND